ncbi:MAG TPA: hypothetical protein VFS75_02900 [Candidatus Paceibacterota bacterium]|nr:hypothetical protein [Candidatus Paceibacterota bacterium]
MVRRIAYLLIALMPLPLYGKWVHAGIPFTYEAGDSYRYTLRDGTSCYVGRLYAHPAVVFYVIGPVERLRAKGTTARYARRTYDEAVIDAESGKLREYNHAEIVPRPYGTGYPEVLPDGDIDFPCKAFVAAIPSRYVRLGLTRFLERLERAQNSEELFLQ